MDRADLEAQLSVLRQQLKEAQQRGPGTPNGYTQLQHVPDQAAKLTLLHGQVLMCICV